MDNLIVRRMKQLSKYEHMIDYYHNKYLRKEIDYTRLKNHLIKIKKGIIVLERKNNLLPNAWIKIIKMKFLIDTYLIIGYPISLNTPIDEEIKLQ